MKKQDIIAKFLALGYSQEESEDISGICIAEMQKDIEPLVDAIEQVQAILNAITITLKNFEGNA